MKNLREELERKIEERNTSNRVLPRVELGDVVSLNDVWDGETQVWQDEEAKEDGKLGSCAFAINEEDAVLYKFKLIEYDGEIEKGQECVIVTSIELV